MRRVYLIASIFLISSFSFASCKCNKSPAEVAPVEQPAEEAAPVAVDGAADDEQAPAAESEI
ncbi:MAG: hypothetical protein O2897_00175 [bacterium]|nr:hypothetical protein [bacterium]